MEIPFPYFFPTVTYQSETASQTRQKFRVGLEFDH